MGHWKSDQISTLTGASALPAARRRPAGSRQPGWRAAPRIDRRGRPRLLGQDDQHDDATTAAYADEGKRGAPGRRLRAAARARTRGVCAGSSSRRSRRDGGGAEGLLGGWDGKVDLMVRAGDQMPAPVPEDRTSGAPWWEPNRPLRQDGCRGDRVPAVGRVLRRSGPRRRSRALTGRY